VDEQSFADYMKKQKKSARTIKRYIAFLETFAHFLDSRGKSLQDATPEDLQAYIDYGENKYKPFSHYLASITVYYEFTSNERMRWALHEIDYPGTKLFKLTKHIGAAPEHLSALASVGITTARQLLQAGKTHRDRVRLSEKTGIPYEGILELVKLSDLSRSLGPVRCRLYYDAGFDTFDKIADCEPPAFREMIKEYIERTGVDYIHPAPKEAICSVEGARRRPRIVEY
jgi:hypothetical protein